ncbi:hypothetical protein Dda_5663 [Drechslerella dactyloides]|uniref:WD40 repeat-like protein n=1 Tax=Drechslerella dactyloides TaxID=74499 RepID=A0AAD6NKF0_DREDA|nr:hypothetical protein Dda_5663 [Drechslerella dactyloides]
MGTKRKRHPPTSDSSPVPSTDMSSLSLDAVSFQVVAGSYDRVLHGLRATVTGKSCSFTPLFLFNAHASSIRCLAVSPAESNSATGKRVLATSSPDTKINLYHLHTRTHLGSLAPPSASPTTSLSFPSKSTLISTDEAGYIHIFRTRDWSLLTSMHCPAPKPRPGAIAHSGIGGGVSDLAVHPSGKLALSVSRNERAVRMWNLMTGRKAGVLAFPKSIPRLIAGIAGDGIKVAWRPGKDSGYAVLFERGVVLFGADSEIKGTITAQPVSKLHQILFLEVPSGDDTQEVCIVATEDGRVLLYSLPKPAADEELKPTLLSTITPSTADRSRIKDFSLLPHPSQNGTYFLTTANSNGIIRVYALDFGSRSDEQSKRQKVDKEAVGDTVADTANAGTGIAHMLGEYDTNRRITCLITAEVDESAVKEHDEDADEASDDGSNSDSDGDSESDVNIVEDAEEDEEWGGIAE